MHRYTTSSIQELSYAGTYYTAACTYCFIYLRHQRTLRPAGTYIPPGIYIPSVRVLLALVTQASGIRVLLCWRCRQRGRQARCILLRRYMCTSLVHTRIYHTRCHRRVTTKNTCSMFNVPLCFILVDNNSAMCGKMLLGGWRQ